MLLRSILVTLALALALVACGGGRPFYVLGAGYVEDEAAGRQLGRPMNAKDGEFPNPTTKVFVSAHPQKDRITGTADILRQYEAEIKAAIAGQVQSTCGGQLNASVGFRGTDSVTVGYNAIMTPGDDRAWKDCCLSLGGVDRSCDEKMSVIVSILNTKVDLDVSSSFSGTVGGSLTFQCSGASIVPTQPHAGVDGGAADGGANDSPNPGLKFAVTGGVGDRLHLVSEGWNVVMVAPLQDVCRGRRPGEAAMFKGPWNGTFIAERRFRAPPCAAPISPALTVPEP
jgi:hypothetical protein